MKATRFLMFLLLSMTTTNIWCQQEIYDKYVARKNLYVAYVTDFRLDSANTVDVVLIIGQDSMAWDSLLAEFNLPPARPIAEMKREGNLGFVHCLRNSLDPAQPLQIDRKEEGLVHVHVNYYKRRICMFFLDNEKQLDAILTYNFKQGLDDSKRHQINTKK